MPIDPDQAADARKRLMLKRRIDAENKAAKRVEKRESGYRTISIEVLDRDNVVEAVRRYASEKSIEATIAEPLPNRETDLRDLTVGLVDVPVLRQMVRRYAEALNTAHWHHATDPTPYGGAPACDACGAPRMREKIATSTRPY